MRDFDNEIIEFDDFKDDEFTYIKNDMNEQLEFIKEYLLASSNEFCPLYHKNYFTVIPGSEEYWISARCKTEFYGCKLIIRYSENKKFIIKNNCFFNDVDKLQKQGFIPVIFKEYLEKVVPIRNKNGKISVYTKGLYNDISKHIMPLSEYRMNNTDIKNLLMTWQLAKKDMSITDDNINNSVIHRLAHSSPYFIKSMICSYL